MDTSRGKKIYNEEKMEDDQEEEDHEQEEEDDDDAGLIRYGDHQQAERRKSSRTLTRNRSSGGGGLTLTRPPPSCSCQVEDCRADMSISKPYHRRHKVCEFHAKAPVVLLSGLHQRFCQQCSRFHVLAEFDEAKRSCRRRLAGHNERRRKISSEYHGEAGSS